MEKNDPFQLSNGYTAFPEQFRDDNAVQKEEGLLLHALVRACKPKIAVETGSHFGVSSAYIALALRENSFKTNDLPFNEPKKGHLWTCDIQDLGAATNLLPFSDWVTFKVCKGIELPIPGKIDFLFIDGNHEDFEVIGEFNYFKPHLSENAVVVFHDCHEPSDPKTPPQVNAGIKKLGIKTVLIPSLNRMRIYFHGYDTTETKSKAS
jgi:predicted O-methyltransferase YrrM